MRREGRLAPRTLPALCALLASAALAPARATAADIATALEPAPRFALAVERDTLYRLDSGYDLFTRDEGDSAPGLSLTYDLLRPGPRATVAVGIGWNAENLSSQWGGSNRAELEVNTFQGALTARYALLWWLEPQVRVAAGVSLAHAELAVAGESQHLAGKARSLMGSAGGGLRLRTRSARLVGLRLRASFATEAGIAAGTPLSLKLNPDPVGRDSSAAARDRVPTTPLNLGSLGRIHPYLRFTIALHF